MKPEDRAKIDEIIEKMLPDPKDVPVGVDEEGNPFIEVEIPEVDTIDLGEFCVDCRDPVDESTEKFASRRPEVREQGNTRLKGFLCEECFPMEGTLMEPTVQALKGRRWDEALVRERMRAIGEEEAL